MFRPVLPILLCGGLLISAGCRKTFWSPDSRSVLVAASGQLWRSDVQSGDWKHLVKGRTRHLEPVAPAWAPDGSRIACLIASAGGPGATGALSLEVLDARTGAREVVVPRVPTPFPDGEDSFQDRLILQCSVAWAPDGSRLLYTHRNAVEGPGKPGGLAWTVAPRAGARPERFAPEWELARPVWSPDSAHVAAPARRLAPGEGSDTGVALLAADGSRGRMVWSPPDGGSVHACAWAPDGRRIGVLVAPKKERDDQEDTSDAWILNTSDWSATRLGRAPAPVWGTTLSPGLDALLYVRDRDAADAETSPTVVLWPPPGVPTFLRPIGAPAFGGSLDAPAFSPDGKWISALYGREGGGLDLWVLAADGTTLKALPVPPIP